MDQNLVIGIVICCIITMVFFQLLLFSAKKDFERLDKQEKEIHDYLETVLKRISLTTSFEALVLLNDEMFSKIDTFKFNQRTHLKWMKVLYYLLGKAHGLKKRTDVNLTIS